MRTGILVSGKHMPPAGGSRPPSAASGRPCRSSPRSGVRSNALGGYLFSRGRIDEAIEAYREVERARAASASAHNNLGAALQMKGVLRGAAGRSAARWPSSRRVRRLANLGTLDYFLGEFPRRSRSTRVPTGSRPTINRSRAQLADVLADARPADGRRAGITGGGTG